MLMVVAYKTRNSVYPITMVGALEAITAGKGRAHEGKLYGVVGFWNDDTLVDIRPASDGIYFFHKENQTEIPYDELQNFLYPVATPGRKMIARLINESSDSFFVSERSVPGDIIITSRIERIVK
jgi:hypothetical protein